MRAQPPRWVERMAGLARLGLGEFRERYWKFRPDYDRGQASNDYWRLVLEGTGVPLNGSTLESLKAADAASWMDYREEVWEIALAFRRGGGRTALLSNGVPEVMARVRADRDLAHYFDVSIVSYEIGCTKPDPRIYETCLSSLGVEADAALFVDDRLTNIEGARKVGMRTLHFIGDESVAELRRLTGLTPA